MPSNRSFGQEISGNRRCKGELSSEILAFLLSKLEDGERPGKKAQHRPLASMPRSDRPPELTPAEKGLLYLLVRRNPRPACSAIPQSLRQSTSRRTIRRAMGAIGLRK